MIFGLDGCGILISHPPHQTKAITLKKKKNSPLLRARLWLALNGVNRADVSKMSRREVRQAMDALFRPGGWLAFKDYVKVTAGPEIIIARSTKQHLHQLAKFPDSSGEYS